MKVSEIQAIDVHGHFGSMDRGPDSKRSNDFMSASAPEVVRRACLAQVEWTIVSPLQAMMPRGGGDAYAANLTTDVVVTKTRGLLQYVVIDPRDDRTFEQADALLAKPTCVGIKIHPEEHVYPISEHGRRIFEFAAERKAIVLGHSSEQNSLAADYVRFADEFPEMRLILAHLGCGWDNDLTHQVRAIQKCRSGNVYVDTSSGSSLTPGLIEWAVQEIGTDRILFGSDTPLFFTPMQRARIDFADLADDDKKSILRDNAIKLFGLSE